MAKCIRVPAAHSALIGKRPSRPSPRPTKSEKPVTPRAFLARELKFLHVRTLGMVLAVLRELVSVPNSREQGNFQGSRLSRSSVRDRVSAQSMRLVAVPGQNALG